MIESVGCLIGLVYLLVGTGICAALQIRVGNAAHWSKYLTLVFAWPAVLLFVWMETMEE